MCEQAKKAMFTQPKWASERAKKYMYVLAEWVINQAKKNKDILHKYKKHDKDI